MYKLLVLIISLSIGQIAFAQSEKMEIDGAVILSNNTKVNPDAGTIRWTGQDFEGFDGSVWISLTNCDGDVIVDPPTCPHSNYDSHSISNLTSSSVKVTVNLSRFLPMRLSYYPSSNPAGIIYRNCENSTNYDTHIQTISGLSSATEYIITVQTAETVGSACTSMTWQNVSCPITITTL